MYKIVVNCLVSIHMLELFRKIICSPEVCLAVWFSCGVLVRGTNHIFERFDLPLYVFWYQEISLTLVTHLNKLYIVKMPELKTKANSMLITWPHLLFLFRCYWGVIKEWLTSLIVRCSRTWVTGSVCCCWLETNPF
jgi:hypothetical protein